MAASRKLTYDDLWIFKEMGNIALSPDGRRVAFVMQSKDSIKDSRQNAIWLLQLDERGHTVGTARQLTSGVKNDINPTWAPDSKRLLFVSNREEEKKQLWLIDTDGGEAHKLTNMLHGAGDASWSPDGQWIAFTSAAAPSDDDDLLVGRKKLAGADKKKYEDEERYRQRTITQVWYRLDGRGVFEKFDQLFVMPAPTPEDISVDPALIRCLTSGEYDHVQPYWLPDSNEISVLCNRGEDRDRSSVTDLWLINRETGDACSITDGTLQIACYAWSPDGKRVILVAEQDMRKEGVCNERLYLVSRDGGKIETLADEIDNNAYPPSVSNFGRPVPYRPQWSKDGQRVYFLATERGCANVYCLDMVQKVVTRLTDEDYLNYYIALLPWEQGLILVQSQPLHPWEFYLYLAAQGFACFYCNPHGSSGRGQDFMREVMGDWGGWDFQDIMLGVDECIARGVVDPERMVVSGYSYGGYMTMYVIGQTDRFKAAVPMAGISNLTSFVGTCDIGLWMVMESKGYPWDPAREAYYRERSPLTHAARVATPTCIIHPENDLRCPIEQSEQFYMALKMMGKVPVEFVRGPSSWHANTARHSQFFGRW